MFLRGWDIRIQPTFQSKVTKNRACNPNMIFDASNHINYEKVTPKGPPKINQKSKEINIGTLKGTPDCTLAPSDD